MRIVVTGSAGFIGFHLCERLLADGHEIVGVDNFISGSRDNIDMLCAHARFAFHEHDVCGPLRLDPPLDRIYNLACPASPADFGPQALEIMDVCSRGVWQMLDLARQHDARLLHASTSEVYGDPQEHPQREGYWGHVNPVGPRSCYDEGKRFAEALITSYARQHGVACRLPRIFNTYGPRMRRDDGRMLPTFIAQALAGKPLTVHGDGSQTRSFCYVSDLVAGLVALMESNVTEPLNLGNPAEISVLQAAREVVGLTGGRSKIRHLDAQADDPKLRQPDITRARQRLDWTPRVERGEGFRRTIEWMRTAP